MEYKFTTICVGVAIYMDGWIFNKISTYHTAYMKVRGCLFVFLHLFLKFLLTLFTALSSLQENQLPLVMQHGGSFGSGLRQSAQKHKLLNSVYLGVLPYITGTFYWVNIGILSSPHTLLAKKWVIMSRLCRVSYFGVGRNDNFSLLYGETCWGTLILLFVFISETTVHQPHCHTEWQKERKRKSKWK